RANFLNGDQVKILQDRRDYPHNFRVVQLRLAEDLDVERRDANRIVASRRRRRGRSLRLRYIRQHTGEQLAQLLLIEAVFEYSPAEHPPHSPNTPPNQPLP